MLLKGKTALVTGCSRGIGKKILENFCSQGADVFANFRKYDEKWENYCKNLSEKTGTAVTPVYFDLSDPEQIKAGVKTIMSAKKPIDILVNNAGIVPDNSLFQMTSIESMKQIFELNYFAQVQLTQYVLRLMAKSNSGSIIFLSSIAGQDGAVGQAAYASSKAAIIGLTKVLAKELAPKKIRVNAVTPGYIETDMLRGVLGDNYDGVIQSIGMKRAGDPSEVGDAIVFLASDLSSYITGQVLRIDGGM